MDNIYIPPKKKKRLRIARTEYPDKRYSFNEIAQNIHNQLKPKNV